MKVLQPDASGVMAAASSMFVLATIWVFLKTMEKVVRTFWPL